MPMRKHPLCWRWRCSFENGDGRRSKEFEALHHRASLLCNRAFAGGNDNFTQVAALASLPYTAVVIGARPAEAVRPLAPMMADVAGRRSRHAPHLPVWS